MVRATVVPARTMPKTSLSTKSWRAPAVVSVFLFFAANAALAAAEENLGSDGSPAGLGFIVPDVQLGDAIAYEHNVTQDEQSYQDGSVATWQRVGPIRLPDGTEVDGQALSIAMGGDYGSDAMGGDQGYEFTWSSMHMSIYDGGTDRLVAVDWSGADSMEFSYGFLPFLQQTSGGGFSAEGRDFQDELLPDCLHSGIFAGQTLAPGTSLTLPPCGGYYLSNAATVVLEHNDTTGSAEGLLAFEGTVDDRWLQLWFAAGIAYPVRMSQVWSEPDCDPCALDLAMAGFQPGAEPRLGGSTAEPSAEPYPAVEWSTRDRIMVDDAGSDVLFPLSDAVEAAMGPQGGPDMIQYLLEHPDAIVVTAMNSRMDSGPLRQDGWTLTFSDESEAITVSVTRPYLADDAASGLRDLFPPYVTTHDDDAEVTDPSGLPTEVPTIVSLAERVAWFGGGESTCFGYDFGSWAAEGGDPYNVGRCDLIWEQSVNVDPPGLNDTGSVDLHAVSFNATAGATAYYSVGLDLSSSYAATPPLAGWDSAPQADAEEETPRVLVQTLMPSAGHAATAGAIAVGGGLLVWLALAAKGGPLLGLFSRQRQDSILDHPARRRIMDAIEARPGIHFKLLERTTGLANGALVHHTRVLVEGGLVTLRKGQGYSCYFPASASGAVVGTAASLKADGARRILDAIAKRPSASALEIGEVTGLSPGTVHHHIQRLSAAGLVKATRQGRQLALEATPLADAALAA